MTTLGKAFCPYCFVVVRVSDGVLVEHRVTSYLNGRRRPCRGSGQAP